MVKILCLLAILISIIVAISFADPLPGSLPDSLVESLVIDESGGGGIVTVEWTTSSETVYTSDTNAYTDGAIR